MRAPQIIKRKYDSGFEAEFVLRPNFNQRFFGIIVDFGSSDPQRHAGTAHFLEHKLFAKESGDLSHEFEKIGADVNAFTSFNETMFYCSGISNNQTLIKLLFRLVGEPYFTEKNVAQEEPIIQQELAMYQDEPNWAVNNTLMKQMFGNSNLGIDVAGTKETIAAITAQDLLECYQQNYVASKMHFIACGDFSDYQVKTLLRLVGKLSEQYFKKQAANKCKIVCAKGQLQSKVLVNKSESNLFGIGLRLPNFKKVLSSRDLSQIMLEIMLESKLSVTSPWFERMRKHNLLSNSLQISVNYTREGNFATIFGISGQSKMVIQEIKDELNKPLQALDRVYLHKFYDLKKKEWLAQTIRSLDDLSYLAVECAEESLDGENSFENIQKLQLLSFDDFASYCASLMKDYQFCAVRLEKGEAEQ